MFFNKRISWKKILSFSFFMLFISGFVNAETVEYKNARVDLFSISEENDHFWVSFSNIEGYAGLGAGVDNNSKHRNQLIQILNSALIMGRNIDVTVEYNHDGTGEGPRTATIKRIVLKRAD